MQYSSAADATGRMVLRKKSFKASPLVMGFASFKIVCTFIISDASAKAQGKTQIAAKSLSHGVIPAPYPSAVPAPAGAGTGTPPRSGARRRSPAPPAAPSDARRSVPPSGR